MPAEEDLSTSQTAEPALQPAPQPAPLPANFVFPPDLLHLWDERMMRNFHLLNRGYEDEAQLKQNIETVRWNTCVTYDGLISLGHQVGYVERKGLEGAYVETGCWMGGSAGMAALVNLQKSDRRRMIHLFDSFQGLPEPSAKDYSQSFADNFRIAEEDCRGRMEPIDMCVAKQSDVEDCLFRKVGYPQEYVRIHVGWFRDTIPAIAPQIGPIAILRLDGDFYESTWVALEGLYPHVVPGGLVVIDDWCLSGCRRAVQDYFAKIGIDPYVHFADGCVRYFFKP